MVTLRSIVRVCTASGLVAGLVCFSEQYGFPPMCLRGVCGLCDLIALVS